MSFVPMPESDDDAAITAEPDPYEQDSATEVPD